jgi:peptide/nickel transport system permease protein
MSTYVIRRVLIAVPVFIIITMAIFVLVRQTPGDPMSMLLNPEMMSGAGAEEFIERRRAELGLGRPVAFQYVAFMREAVTGNLGYSIFSRRPVTEFLLERMPPTLLLMGSALVIAVCIGVPVGIVAAIRKNSFIDYIAAVFSLSVISIPSFFLGLVAIYVFALTLGWLPSAGMGPPGEGTWVFSPRHLLMPASILGLALAGPLVRYVRSGLLDELGKDYVRTAVAKGASPGRTVVRHALRNSLLPLITVIAIYIPQMLAGAVVLEQIFAWPGMGQLAVSSIAQRDYPIIIGFTMLVAVFVLTCNLIADILYSFVDPRISLR